MNTSQPDTVSLYVFSFDPIDEVTRIGGFNWYWSEGRAKTEFNYACNSVFFVHDALSVLKMQVPVTVIEQGSQAICLFLDKHISEGPFMLLHHRPAKTKV